MTWRHFLTRLARDRALGLDGRRSLVLAPHPDDEVLGCGGVLAQKVRASAPVWVVFLTDGRRGLAGGPSPVTELREQEAREAATLLGVPHGHLFFLRFPDGELSRHLDEAAGRVRRLVDALGIQDLFAPYRRDYHPDHMAACRVAQTCLRPGVRLYEYPIWYGPYLWRRLRGRARVAALAQLREICRATRVRVADVLEVKRRALAAYRSQLEQFEALGPWGMAFLQGFLTAEELFFEQP